MQLNCEYINWTGGPQPDQEYGISAGLRKIGLRTPDKKNKLKRSWHKAVIWNKRQRPALLLPDGEVTWQRSTCPLKEVINTAVTMATCVFIRLLWGNVDTISSTRTHTQTKTRCLFSQLKNMTSDKILCPGINIQSELFPQFCVSPRGSASNYGFGGNKPRLARRGLNAWSALIRRRW